MRVMSSQRLANPRILVLRMFFLPELSGSVEATVSPDTFRNRVGDLDPEAFSIQASRCRLDFAE